MPSARELLIAWNTHPRMSRPAICRLGQLLCQVAEAGGGCGAMGAVGAMGAMGAMGDTGDTGDLGDIGDLGNIDGFIGDFCNFGATGGMAGMGLSISQLERAFAARAGAAGAAAREETKARRLGARLVTLADAGYPPLLRQLALPPPVLAVRGELPGEPAVAVVGSRHPDAYGWEVADLFGRALAGAGVAVVSGFARGIDAAAHRAALTAGWTVGVLGCGLGVDYPPGHARLGEEIAARGALISEFPCGLPPRPWHFPVRNRVIAALSQATLVVQAALRSGSLSTAYHALELGREVWAVPGGIFDELAAGTNALLHEGAGLARHPDDILEPLGRSAVGGGAGFSTQRTFRGVSPASAASAPRTLDAAGAASGAVGAREPGGAARGKPAGLAGDILAVLERGAMASPEQIAGQLATRLDRVLAGLLELEIEAWIERLPGSLYRRSRHPP